MCGIVGIRDFQRGNAASLEPVASMTDCLKHRGPDDRGVFIDEAKGVALGHQRLSILDLSQLGHQPMGNEKKTLQIAYNGEVYNFKEIQRELVKYGKRFTSSSDTEVILRAYEQWGMEALHRFHGMFAFVLWDAERQQFILCRDRAGVKPLYYYRKDGLLLAASELKSFHKHPKFQKKINLQALSLFFQFGYIPAPYTIFEDTYKVMPGTYRVFDTQGNSQEIQYWDIRDLYAQEPFHKTEKELVSELDEILSKAFQYRMVADVPVGVFLSGGIDSATVAAVLQSRASSPLKTFTIGFHEQGYDEAPHAKRIAEHIGSDHHELYVTKEMAAEVIPKLSEIYDEPFGDSAGIPTYLVTQLARQEVKVALAGDGGDELFGGYTKYSAIDWYFGKRQVIPGGIFRSAAFALNMFSPEAVEYMYELLPPSLRKYTNLKDKVYKLKNILRETELSEIFRTGNTFWTEQQLARLFTPSISTKQIDLYGFGKMQSINPISQMQAADFRVYLPDDVFVRMDRATMALGLEGREPFLDQDIAEYIARVPSSWKIRNGKGKYILRQVLSRYLPPELVERPKQGFGIPIYDWMRKDFSRFLEEYLSPARLRKHGLFEEQEVTKGLQAYLKGRKENAHKLWYLLMFQMWHERWME
jgi:asparagine synthase (glutamine-hydrolysing)